MPNFRAKPGQIDYSNARWAPVINSLVKYKDKILLVKRSKNLRFFPGYWNGISGFLDDRKNLNEKIKTEIEEEIGVKEDGIKAIKIGQIFTLDQPKYKKVFIVFPVLVEIKTSKIKLNYEASQYKWVSANDLKKYKLVPGFNEVVKSVI